VKKIIAVLFMLLVFLGAKSEDKKTFTKEEFDKKVEAEVNRQVDLIKKKSISSLSKELLAKERDLKDKEEILKNREEQIALGEQSLLKKIEEFDKTKEKIIGCVDENKRNEQMRIKQLVDVISNMKPAKAADLLSVQESSISVKLIEKIPPQKASKIFNLMDKEVSARLQKQYLNMQK